MLRYHERFGHTLNADPRTGDSTRERWAALLGGIMLVLVSAVAVLYRGSLEWMDVVTAIVGFALLGVSAYEIECS